MVFGEHQFTGLLLTGEALANIHRFFDSPNGLVAEFLGEPEGEVREIRRRFAFEVVQAMLALVGA
jgi:hypothetical protein